MSGASSGIVRGVMGGLESGTGKGKRVVVVLLLHSDLGKHGMAAELWSGLAFRGWAEDGMGTASLEWKDILI